MALGTVGELRQNCALSGADDRIELVCTSDDPEVRAFVGRLVVFRAFPDTRSRDGSIRSVLRIEVAVKGDE
jgi:hypothetical protein